MIPLVLAVDDDRSSHILLRAHLLDEKFCAHFVGQASGRDALEFLTTLPATEIPVDFPDVIFLDINMPEMDGWEFLDALTPVLQRHEKLPAIVMLSATNTDEAKEKAAAHPLVLSITTKPLRGEVLDFLRHYPTLKSFFDQSDISNA